MQSPGTAVLQAGGYTIFDAVRNIIGDTGFKLYYQHLFYVVLGRELVKRDIIGPLDFFMRDHEPRLRSWVLIADGRAESIIKTKGIMHPLPAVEIDEKMKSGKSIGKYPMVQLFDLMRMMSHKDKAGYLPRIRVAETEKQKYLQVLGAEMVKGGKAVGDLNAQEARGLLWVQNKIKSTIVVVPLDDQNHYASIEILRSKTRIQPSYDGKQLRIRITVKPTGNIGELDSPPYPLNVQMYKTLEEKQDEIIKDEIQKLIEKAQKKKADIFGFEDFVHRAYPQEWKEWKGNWPEVFANTSIIVEVKSHLLQNGLKYEQHHFRGE